MTWRPHGLRVVEGALSEEDEQRVLSLARSEMDGRPTLTTRDSNPSGRSRLLRLGYGELGELVEGGEIPAWLRDVRALLPAWTRGAPFDSVVLCEYRPGGGIDAHADSPVYVGQTSVLCLGADATLTMRPTPGTGRARSSESYSVSVPRRSLYAMEGEALRRCTHEVAVAPGGGPRVSVVFRATDAASRAARSSSTATRAGAAAARPPGAPRID